MNASRHDDGVDPVVGAELSRRLDGLAATTVLDPEAWESFESRRTAAKSTGHSRLTLVAVAAASVAVLGVAFTLVRDDGRESVGSRPGPVDTLPPTGPTTTDLSVPPGQPRTPPALILDAGDYEIELLYVEARQEILLRRTDDVGSWQAGGPDAYGYNRATGWGAMSEGPCLVSSGGEFTFYDAPTHAFTLGLATADITRVEVVMAGGERRPAAFSTPDALGLRVWLVERPLEEIERIEGFAADDRVIATITEFLPADWGNSGCHA